MSTTEDANSSDTSSPGTVDDLVNGTGSLSSAVLGSVVGVPMGSVCGAAVCYITGLWDALWYGVIAGAITGLVMGLVTTLIYRKLRGIKPYQVIATPVGIVIGCVPTVALLMQVAGNLNLRLLLGGVFIGPATGLLIGAFFDRAIDEWKQRRRAAAISFSALGLGLCCGLIFWINSATYRLSEDDIKDAVQQAVSLHWEQDPELSDATIENIVVVREGRRAFSGTFNAMDSGATIRFEFEAQDRGADVVIEWQALME